MSRAHRRTFTGAAGNDIAASELGEGRPVLFLAGGGQTRHAWDNTLRAVAAAGYRGIAIDQRGHGDSPWMADGAYSFFDFAADASAVADRIAAETGSRPVAVGASLGGIASLLALGRRPDVFAGLVLVDVAPHLEESGLASIQGFMRSAGAAGFASIEEAADAVAAYLPHRPRPKSLEGLRKNLRLGPDGRWRWHWDPRFLDGPRSVNGDYAEVFPAKLAAARSLTVPTLLVRGLSSELVTPEAAAKFRELCPAAEVIDIGGARHMVAGDRNDAFSTAILAFLARAFPAPAAAAL